MQPGGCKPEHDVAGSDAMRSCRSAFHRADRKAREIVVACLVQAGHLGGLSADQRAARCAATCGDSFHDLRTDLRRKFSSRKVVEEEQRLGALHDQIVHRHGNEVDADRLVPPGLDRDQHLGADAVGPGDQDRIGKTGALEVEQAAEAADFAVGARAGGRAHERPDQLDHPVAGVDIHARVRIGQLFSPFIHAVCPTSERRVTQCPGRSSPQQSLASRRAGGICQIRDCCRGPTLSIPNLITLARILLVPVVVWAIASNQMLVAFLLFAAAGISDAVDGFLAKRFGMASELGAYLDPLADKVLIVAIYVSLGIVNALPGWLVILVVSRDLLIVGGVMFSWLLGKPVGVKPHPVSKVNTAVQLLLVGLVLASLGLGFAADWALKLIMAAVAVLTLASVAVYLREWVRHMGVNGIKR